MSSRSTVAFLQRRFVRARVDATAVIMGRHNDSRRPASVDERVECAAQLVVENLSAGGVLLLGGTGWYVGQDVELELRFTRGVRIQARAMVVRIESHRTPHGAALQFQDLPPATEVAIQDAVWAAIARNRSGAKKVVVVTPEASDARQMGPMIMSLGMDPVFVTSLFEALRWLQDPDVVVSALLLDVHAEGELALDAMKWCAEAFPDVRRALIAGHDTPEQARNLRRINTHAIVKRPLVLRRLARALGVRAPHQPGEPPPEPRPRARPSTTWMPFIAAARTRGL